jgi:endogenous inhibitor of DNA gyrase (YacG/DUF329 family)
MTTDRIAACPHCGTSTRLDSRNPWRPFCSERCKLVDLGDWLTGRYVIPVRDETAPDANPALVDDGHDQ